jgi:two-component system cell cycle sensor histidine kinase/response regulator CckA
VTVNAVQVEQIVMNLVTNARDAMPEGGRLLIRTSNAPAEEAHERDAVIIAITDTGGGIDPAVRDRIFDPYFTTRAEIGGTGVGLATVRGIAHLHGGRVDVESAPGRGATFRVVLPRASAPEAVATASQPVQPEAPARILLVENEPAVREYLQRCLSAAGYQVKTAGTGAEALSEAEAAHPPADVIVADVHLPDAEGPDVARRLRERWPAARVVFMSGGLDALDRLAEAGAVPLLAKPFTASELVKTIRAVLASHEGG